MPRFSVAFGRRKSTAENADNAPAEPSFRVLERPDAGGNKFHEAGKSFDGAMRLGGKAPSRPKTSGSDIHHDNLFAGINRGSASSSTTKATSTDNSSRHSNTSTAPSSADSGDVPVPPIPKSSSAGLLKAAGRTFSFGGGKKPLPVSPAEQEPVPPLNSGAQDYNQILAPTRPRATTTSTSTTVTPPRVEDDLGMDLGGDFEKMVLGNEKRVTMVGKQNNQNSQTTQPGLGPRSLTGNRLSQPSPIQVDRTAKVEPAQPSWTSQRSNDQLLSPTSPPHSPRNREMTSPPSRHMSPLARGATRPSASPESNPRKPLLAHQNSDTEQGEGEDEEARLLMDSLSTVSKYMDEGGAQSISGPSAGSRYRRGGNGLPSGFKDTALGDDDSLFDTNHSYAYETTVSRNRAQDMQSQGANKVMTPAEFEKYRKDKERQDRERQMDIARNQDKSTAGEEDDEDNYDDEEDDLEKAKQQAKQRKKQEAHMSVYRQQMMKVTGESANAPMPRPNLQMSFSTPNLQISATGTATSDNSDEDEEVPLAILAAHGFPNKNRPPTRLSTMMSNPNLRAAQEPSYQRPGSAAGGAAAAIGGHLPAFARNLPQDPFLGAGLVRNNPRENFALGGGSPAPVYPNPAGPPGGLIGVIASEERARAMRRGSPHIEAQRPNSGAATFDPLAGIPPHMLYANKPSLTPGDQAQIQMTQQMQQFMQMQMQFMQMMAGQNSTGAPRPEGHMATGSIGSIGSAAGMSGGFAGLPPMHGVPGGLGLGGPDLRHSFMGNESMLDLPPPRGDAQKRTMSMVQPSSASWIHPQQPAGFAPSIRVTGGYAPSIAPSERSNVGLPGRYRPVSQMAPPALPAMSATVQPLGASHMRKSSTMSGVNQPTVTAKQSGSASDDDDDEQGWEDMKAKREKKRSLWKRKKSVSGAAGTLIM
ncbi:hypothetical protein GE21DRAFT_986 [Neurospora crassa]|uniref:Uncharacterized protein n=1 Tax=Neurospora crassa (strain ATCC 24698 / 74-OR23-1A / CBS 708.71 / DSM 1257 / FGSC 987) TaxID=367110 RepID=V5IQW5_NEUCR|nr:uncharacterized protein NCU09370 [Neurospora crassa OR74A]XP_011393280.1 hypothetical protein NCU09370 [Neurospora crassa OR74A]ESA43983.1 hypothetical protein NCU09370 [Neurospora crassa OR74A]ESA43984.1 hypothetical protein, variant [Neurospora crassa OR74A]KHE78429.1 hypothetical protein GE21DRAFT_986 [Neurospora crassa]|eukprot:XP_011393279.1 uncharacterized protein NCU09370 [Neurospora crassa OR74A]